MKRLLMIVTAAVACSAFADDAYVASSGGQAINTGYYLKSNTKLEIDFQVETVEQYKNIFGADGGSGTLCSLWLRADCGIEPRLGGWCQPLTAGDMSRHVVVYDLPARTVELYAPGGTTPIATKTSADGVADNGNATYPIVLFANSNDESGATVWRNSACRIYSFKVWEKNGGTYDLVHSWKPAMKGGEVGFVDSVDGSFIREHRLGNVASLDIGGDYAVVDDDGYIESAGTTTISTGVLLDPDMRIEVDYAVTDIYQPKARILGNTAGQVSEFYFNDEGEAMAFCIGNGWVGGQTILYKDDCDTRRHTFVADVPNHLVSFMTGCTTNRTVEMKTGAGQPVDGVATLPLTLFGRISNANGVTDDPALRGKTRIYGARFYRSGTLVANLVPCVKGDVPGFRDTVSGVFHTGECNLEGLSAGGAVERIADDGFIELCTEGGHIIDTDYFPNKDTRIEFDYALAANKLNTSAAWTVLHADGNNNNFRLWQDSNNNFYIQLGTSGSKNTSLPPQTNAWHVRRTLILDAPNSAATILTAGLPNFAITNSTSWVASEQSATRSLKIGSWTGGASDFTPVRVYGLKIYENGSLVHEYVPFVKNGAPGLKDGDTFVKVSWNGDATGIPKAGGNVAVSSNRDRDAFVLFAGSQSIDTGYKPNGNTKLVVDFSFANAYSSSEPFVFAAQDDGGNCCLYNQNGGTYRCAFSSGWNPDGLGSIACDHQRRLFMVDALNNQLRFSPKADGSTYNNDSYFVGKTKPNCNITLRIGSKSNGTSNFSRMRLYRFTIYDNDEKVRDFIPYAENGTQGLYDTVSNEVFTAAGLTVSGRGYDGTEEWLATPANIKITKSEAPKTLSATAVGALYYKWTKNGVPINGGADGNLTVEYAKGGATDTYTVTPVYSVFGSDVDGEPVSVTVKNVPPGMMIIVE